jgi:hypothetical protein
MKPRRHIYLEHAINDRLDAHATKTGASASAVVADALRSYFDRRGAKELDDLLGVRLGRQDRKLDVALESIGLLARYVLTVMAPVPDGDAAALAIGQDRFQAFVAQVGRRIASGRGFSHEMLTSLMKDEDESNAAG